MRLSFLRIIRTFIPVFLAVLVGASSLQAADNKAQPVTPPVPAPAFLDVVTFDIHVDGENHKMTLTSGPSQLRVDEPDDSYSIIYDPQSDRYTGLEHRNYTYWEFSWPEVRAAVANTKRYEAHLRDLSAEGLNGYDQSASSSTNSPDIATPTTSAGSDNSGYVWRSTTDKKRVANLDCVRWVGDTISGESVEVWCFNGPLPKMQAAMEQVRKINEPMALVPVRMLVPPLIFPIYDALVKGGVTPVQITWGGGKDRNRFVFTGAKTRDGNLSLFTVPKDFTKTTLITMDGITNPVRETAAPGNKK